MDSRTRTQTLMGEAHRCRWWYVWPPGPVTGHSIVCVGVSSTRGNFKNGPWRPAAAQSACCWASAGRAAWAAAWWRWPTRWGGSWWWGFAGRGSASPAGPPLSSHSRCLNDLEEWDSGNVRLGDDRNLKLRGKCYSLALKNWICLVCMYVWKKLVLQFEIVKTFFFSYLSIKSTTRLA